MLLTCSQMLVVLLLCYSLAAARSTCTVASCDDFMRNTAESLLCDSEQSCHNEVARQLALIVPTDSEIVFEQRKAVVMAIVKSDVCQGAVYCTSDQRTTDLIARLNDWARVPTSSAIARRRLEDLAIEDVDLRNGLCAITTTNEEAEVFPLNCTFLESQIR